MADNLPTVITKAGLQQQAPAILLAQLIAGVAATNPGYTANLPGILIEDISSTDTGALIQCDSARVETVNSLNPLFANDFVFTQIGNMLGVPQGLSGNTSTFVIFSGLPGQVIQKGFIVSDGSFQYQVIDGGAIGSDDQSQQLFVLATQPGTWAVPEGTVTTLVTQPPTGFPLTVFNPEAGLPGTDSETSAQYRARVVQANLAASQGMARFLRTLLGNVPGVQQRLIAVQQSGTNWRIIVGGGDPYLVAYAIWQALFDTANLIGSILEVADASQADPALISTFLNHGFLPDQNIIIAGIDPDDYNGSFAVIDTPTEKTFHIGTRFAAVNVASGSWSGGTVTLITASPHGVTVGSPIAIVGSTPTAYNGNFVAISGTAGTTLKYALVSDPGSLTTPGQLSDGVALFDSTGFSDYVDGGVITPNLRNITTTLTDYPDTFLVTYINPPQQTLTMTVTWNTSSPNFVSPAAVAQLGQPAIVDYVNSVYVGQPIILYNLESVFRDAISSVVPPDQLTRMVFAVAINGVGTPPTSGTGIIAGDPESYFFTAAADINIVQG